MLDKVGLKSPACKTNMKGTLMEVVLYFQLLELVIYVEIICKPQNKKVTAFVVKKR